MPRRRRRCRTGRGPASPGRRAASRCRCSRAPAGEEEAVVAHRERAEHRGHESASTSSTGRAARSAARCSASSPTRCAASHSVAASAVLVEQRARAVGEGHELLAPVGGIRGAVDVAALGEVREHLGHRRGSDLLVLRERAGCQRAAAGPGWRGRRAGRAAGRGRRAAGAAGGPGACRQAQVVRQVGGDGRARRHTVSLTNDLRGQPAIDRDSSLRATEALTLRHNRATASHGGYRERVNDGGSGPAFAVAMRHATVGMALVAPDGSFLEVNPALCAMLGRTEAELARRPGSSSPTPTTWRSTPRACRACSTATATTTGCPSATSARTGRSCTATCRSPACAARRGGGLLHLPDHRRHRGLEDGRAAPPACRERERCRRARRQRREARLGPALGHRPHGLGARGADGGRVPRPRAPRRPARSDRGSGRRQSRGAGPVRGHGCGPSPAATDG